MIWETREEGGSVGRLSEAELRRLDPSPFYRQAYEAFREALLRGRRESPLLEELREGWVRRLGEVFPFPSGEGEVFPLHLELPAEAGAFLELPAEAAGRSFRGLRLPPMDRVGFAAWLRRQEEAFLRALGREFRRREEALFREWAEGLPFRFLGGGGLLLRRLFRRRLRLCCAGAGDWEGVFPSGGAAGGKRKGWGLWGGAAVLLAAAFLAWGRPLPLRFRESGPSREEPAGPLPPELANPAWMGEGPGRFEGEAAWNRSFGEMLSLGRIPYDRSALQGLFWREKDFGNRLILTFDDGPSWEVCEVEGREAPVTEALLDILKPRGIRAVFFVNGCHMAFESEEKDREMRRLFNRMIREGHLIGNHSYHHHNLAKAPYQDGVGDYEEIWEEFAATQRALDRILGFRYPLLLVRPPYAEPGRTALLDKVLRENGLYLISLQLDSYDYAYRPGGYWQEPRLLAHSRELILSRPGGILLMHDRPQSPALLKEILDDPEIREQRRIGDLPSLLREKYGS